MAKVKAFDPSKARLEAEKTVTAAEAEIARLQTKVEPAKKKVTEAEQKQKDAAAAKQKQVDVAKTKLKEINDGIAEQEALIKRAQEYLAATANLEATAVAVDAAPAGEVVDNGEPAVV